MSFPNNAGQVTWHGHQRNRIARVFASQRTIVEATMFHRMRWYPRQGWVLAKAARSQEMATGCKRLVVSLRRVAVGPTVSCSRNYQPSKTRFLGSWNVSMRWGRLASKQWIGPHIESKHRWCWSSGRELYTKKLVLLVHTFSASTHVEEPPNVQ